MRGGFSFVPRAGSCRHCLSSKSAVSLLAKVDDFLVCRLGIPLNLKECALWAQATFLNENAQ
jgi:hypothetical protein